MEGMVDFAALRVFMRIMLTFAFSGSLFILVDTDAYKKLNQILNREHGLTKRMLPFLEEPKTTLEDYVLKNRRTFGVLFLLLSFILLTLY